MIKNFIEQDDSIGIPILDSEEFCWIIWKDGETFEEMYAQNNEKEYSGPYQNFLVFAQNDEEIKFSVYEIKCQKTGNLFYLICDGDLSEFEYLNHWVCVYNNYFNLLKFYSEYLLPFSDKNFVS